MRIITYNDRSTVVSLAACLEGGGIAIVPGDTIYGIFGRVPDSETRIRDIKGRSEKKPFIELLPSGAAVQGHLRKEIDPRIIDLWPAALTVVLDRGKEETVAVRVPDDPFLLRVLRTCESPLYSTSVNRAGQTPLWRASDIIESFSVLVDLFVDGGNRQRGEPSTILDATTRPYRVIRQGSFLVPQSLLS